MFVRLTNVEVHIMMFYSVSFSLIFQSFIFLSPSIRSQIPSIREFPLIGLLSIVLLINTFTFLYAYSKTSIANAVFTHYIAPIIVAVLAALFLKERITLRVILSILIASIGLRIMLGGGTLTSCIDIIFQEGIKPTQDFLGILSGIISGVAYAVLIILIRVYTQKFNSYVLVFIQNCFMVIALFPFVKPVSLKTLWILAFMGAIHSTLAPYLYYRGLKTVEANRAAILGYLEPFGAIIFSMIFLYEYPDMITIVGGFFIIISGFIVIKDNGNPKK